MRIWDISPGYLNRQSLLGEHRELHGLYNILVEGKKGYSRHPETLRWVGAVDGLALRHAQLAAEMRLRGYNDRTPLALTQKALHWPEIFIDEPADQFAMLRGKYVGKEPGRIPLPRSNQEIWAQHKYSVLARDPERYRRIGAFVAGRRGGGVANELALELTLLLRHAPPTGRLANALEHMWGHVKTFANEAERHRAEANLATMFAITQTLARHHREIYLQASTALSELAVYIETASQKPFEAL